MLDPDKQVWRSLRGKTGAPPILRLMWRAGLLWMAIVCGVNARTQQVLFDRITTAEGLPSEQVHALFEDRHGYMWIGTLTGLARMEGTRMRTFHHDRNDSTSIGHDQVNHLAEDASGRLWLATMAGLSLYDEARGKFRTFQVEAIGNAAHQANRMQQVQCIGDSIIWVVSEQGLYRFDTRTRTFRDADELPAGAGPPGHVNDCGALRWDAARGGMWAASSKGLAYWDARSNSWTDHRNATASQPWFTGSPVSAVVLQGPDTLWYFDEKDFVVHGQRLSTGARFHCDSVDGQRNRFTLRWQDTDPDGRLWISTWTHRLFHRAPDGRWEEVLPSAEEPAALRSSRVLATERTRSGDRWFGTSQGIAILRRSSSAMRVLSIPGNYGAVSEIHPVNTDTLVIGTVGQGVFIIDLRTGHATNVLNEVSDEEDNAFARANRIEDISPRGDGTFRVATTYQLATLDPRLPRLAPDPFIATAIPRSQGTHFTFVEPGPANDLWAGTWNRALYHVDLTTGACARVDTLEGLYGRLPSRMMLCWMWDSRGRGWLGMNDGGGVACLENGRFKVYRDTKGGNAGGVVRCIAEAPDGHIWLGTHEEGIVILDPDSGTTRHLDRRNGLPGVMVWNLLFARNGTVWACTSQGLARRVHGAAGFQRITLPDGLDPNSVTGALAELPDGRIAFGVGGRIVLYDPAKDDGPLRAPQATITTFRINDDRYYSEPPPEILRLHADRKTLTLELGAVGLAPRTTPLFRYRMADRDPAWSDIGAAQRIDLFDLSPGDHHIEVQASNNGVDWSVEPASVKVVVLPPFWATWWFRGALLLGISAGLYFFVRGYVHERLREQRERLESEQAVLAERMRIASDMHDDLGAGLSALKLRSEMALRVEKDPAKREQLSSLANTAGDLIGSMRQIIWTMNADQTSVEDLVVYTTNYARTYCEQNGLTITVEASGPWPGARLSSEQRRNMFLVVKEALHNIMKHAHATTVDLRIRWDQGVRIELTDNGVGLPKGTEDAVGNGLRNMRKRIHSLNGTLTMSGEKGTCLRFHVPIPPGP